MSEFSEELNNNTNETDNKKKFCTKCKVNERAWNVTWCKSCLYQNQRENYHKKSVLKKKSLNAKRNYGVTEGQLKEMIKGSSNRCEICFKPFSDISKINIDHCHNTKKVRSLLCKQCNYGIGNFNDDIDLLNNAIKYLKRYKIMQK